GVELDGGEQLPAVVLAESEKEDLLRDRHTHPPTVTCVHDHLGKAARCRAYLAGGSARLPHGRGHRPGRSARAGVPVLAGAGLPLPAGLRAGLLEAGLEGPGLARGLPGGPGPLDLSRRAEVTPFA